MLSPEAVLDVHQTVLQTVEVVTLLCQQYHEPFDVAISIQEKIPVAVMRQYVCATQADVACALT